MSHSIVIPLFDLDAEETGNGLPFEAFRTFYLKYTRATDLLSMLWDCTINTIYQKVRKKGPAWQKCKFLIKFVHHVCEYSSTVKDLSSAPYTNRASGAWKKEIQGIAHQAMLVWETLECVTCPRSAAIESLVWSVYNPKAST